MLREVARADLGALRRWRNHPEVRRSRFTPREISEAEHLHWWAAVSADSSRLVLVYEHADEPAGVVAFSGLDEPGAGAWSFYLDIAGLGSRGELLAARIGLERAAIAYALGPLGLRVLRGEVPGWNAAVLRQHLRCGFIETGRYMRQIDGLAHEVVLLELRRWR